MRHLAVPLLDCQLLRLDLPQPDQLAGQALPEDRIRLGLVLERHGVGLIVRKPAIANH